MNRESYITFWTYIIDLSNLRKEDKLRFTANPTSEHRYEYIYDDICKMMSGAKVNSSDTDICDLMAGVHIESVKSSATVSGGGCLLGAVGPTPAPAGLGLAGHSHNNPHGLLGAVGSTPAPAGLGVAGHSQNNPHGCSCSKRSHCATKRCGCFRENIKCSKNCHLGSQTCENK